MLQITSVPFTLVGPGQTTSGSVWFTSPADASYTSAISPDPNAVFTLLRLTALRPTLEDVIDDPGDPGDGVHPPRPPKHHKELVDEPVAASNGVTPLSVLRGDKLKADIQMVCPADPADVYSATLTITSSNAGDTTTVPLSAPTGEVDVLPFVQEAVAAPGSTATWVFSVHSTAGPGDNLSLTPELDGSPGFVPPSSVSIPPVTVFVPRRGQLSMSLNASVGEVTPKGSYKFPVAETIFADTFTPFALTLTVSAPQVLVTTEQPSAFTMIQGDTVEFNVHVALQGAGTTFNFTINPPPAGLDATFIDAQGQPTGDWHVPLTTQEHMTFPVRLSLAPNAPLSVVPVTLAWSAYDGAAQGTLTFGVTPLPQAIAFSSGTLGPSTTTGFAFWALNAQGFWNFAGQIHESGLIGHDYGFGMSLNVQDRNGTGVAVFHSGSVGANVPLGGPDDSWSDQGFDPRIVDLWPAIVAARQHSVLNVTTDLGHILVAVAEALGVAITAIFVGSHVECDRVPTLDPPDPDRPGIGITWHCRVT